MFSQVGRECDFGRVALSPFGFPFPSSSFPPLCVRLVFRILSLTLSSLFLQRLRILLHAKRLHRPLRSEVHHRRKMDDSLPRSSPSHGHQLVRRGVLPRSNSQPSHHSLHLHHSFLSWSLRSPRHLNHRHRSSRLQSFVRNRTHRRSRHRRPAAPRRRSVPLEVPLPQEEVQEERRERRRREGERDWRRSHGRRKRPVRSEWNLRSRPSSSFISWIVHRWSYSFGAGQDQGHLSSSNGSRKHSIVDVEIVLGIGRRREGRLGRRSSEEVVGRVGQVHRRIEQEGNSLDLGRRLRRARLRERDHGNGCANEEDRRRRRRGVPVARHALSPT